MGYSRLPEPGSKYGPCIDGCEHKDCNFTRADAATPCDICKEPIGFERAFYGAGAGYVGKDPDPLVHAVCLWEQEERRKLDDQPEP